MNKNVLEKIVSASESTVREKKTTDLTVKKLTLKTGIRAGLRAVGAMCGCSCHTR